jgi:hypothetical protein
MEWRLDEAEGDLEFAAMRGVLSKMITSGIVIEP